MRSTRVLENDKIHKIEKAQKVPEQVTEKMMAKNLAVSSVGKSGLKPGNGAAGGPLSVLNVGAKILLRDVMDQYLRTLGDVRTFYASNTKSALRSLSENQIQIMIIEAQLEDGSAQRLLSAMGGHASFDDLWVILALEEKRDDLMALALELNANAVLVKPFSAVDLKNSYEKYLEEKKKAPDAGLTLLKAARRALKEKSYLEADKKFREAMAASPESAVIFYYAGHFYFERPDYRLAEQCLKKALVLRPGYISALSVLGHLYFKRGELDEAFKYLRQAHVLSPLNFERALIIEKCHLAAAREMVTSIFAFDETNPRARLELGKILIAEKDYVGGLFHLERARDSFGKDPAHTEAFNECMTYEALARKLGGIKKPE